MSYFIDQPSETMTGTQSIRFDFRNPGPVVIKLFSITIKIDTAKADPRTAYAEIGSDPFGATKIICMGTASGYNDAVFRFSPPILVGTNMSLAIHGFGDTGNQIGCQIESSDSFNYTGSTQF